MHRATVTGVALLAAPVVLALLLKTHGLLAPLSFFADPFNGAWRLAEHPPEEFIAEPPPGLMGPVRIELTEKGVPRIHALYERDAWLAVGYVHACYRLWEMDLLRRAAEGRLAELVGPQGLDSDVFVRSIGLHLAAEESLSLVERLAEEGDPAAEAALEALRAYSRGVNACIERLKLNNRLPLEYRLLGVEPEPWSPVDSMAVAKLIDYVLGFRRSDLYWLILQARFPWIAGLQRDYIMWLHRLGREIIRDPGAALDASSGLPGGFHGVAGYAEWGERLVLNETIDPEKALGLMQRAAEALEPLAPRVRLVEASGASNNWVVSPSRSISGSALLANDPHLALTAPPIWFEEEVSADDTGLHVYGAAFPGVPFVIIGRTRGLSFGYTNSFVDTTDFYYYVWNGTRYYYKGRWLEPSWRTEEIRVKRLGGGYDTVKVRIPVTIHGPVVVFELGGYRLAAAVRSTTLMPEPIAVWAYLMNHAEDVWDALEAQRYFYSPIQNMVAADREGHIIYSPSGLVPVRSPVPLVKAETPNGTILLENTGWLPFNGSRGEGEWIGFLPFNKLPRLIDPPGGYVASANNMISAEFTPVGSGPYLQWGFHASYRWLRIATLLEKSDKVSVEDVERIQLDQVSEAARRIIPLLMRFTGGEPAQLRGWNGLMAADRVEPSIAFEWLRELQRLAWRRVEEEARLDPVSVAMASTITSLEKLEMLFSSSWGDWYLERMSGGLGAARLARQSLEAALEELRGFYGSDDPAAWVWGRAHRLLAKHALGDVLGWLNLGPTPVGGGPYTVNVAPITRLGEPVTIGPSLRLVADMSAEGVAAYYTMPGGEAGTVFHEHYGDMLGEWLTGGYHVTAGENAARVIEWGTEQ